LTENELGTTGLIHKNDMQHDNGKHHCSLVVLRAIDSDFDQNRKLGTAEIE
jgi:hypothetical protein